MEPPRADDTLTTARWPSSVERLEAEIGPQERSVGRIKEMRCGSHGSMEETSVRRAHTTHTRVPISY